MTSSRESRLASARTVRGESCIFRDPAEIAAAKLRRTCVTASARSASLPRNQTDGPRRSSCTSVVSSWVRAGADHRAHRSPSSVSTSPPATAIPVPYLPLTATHAHSPWSQPTRTPSLSQSEPYPSYLEQHRASLTGEREGSAAPLSETFTPSSQGDGEVGESEDEEDRQPWSDAARGVVREHCIVA